MEKQTTLPKTNKKKERQKKIEAAVKVNWENINELVKRSETGVGKTYAKRLVRNIEKEFNKGTKLSEKLKNVDDLCANSFPHHLVWYFSHRYYNGFSNWQPEELIESSSAIIDPKCDYDKLILTAFRGGGKSVTQKIHQNWAMKNKHSVCTASVAHNQDTAIDNMQRMILLFADTDGSGNDSLYSLLFSKYVSNIEEVRQMTNEESIRNKFRGTSKNAYFDLENGSRVFPISVNGRLRGLEAADGTRLRGIYPDDVEDPSMIGTVEVGKIWELLNSGFTALTNIKEKPVYTILSGNYTEYDGNIHKFSKLSENEESRIRFVNVSYVNKEEKTCNDHNTTYEEAMKKIKASDRPEELLNDPAAGVLSEINVDEIELVLKDSVDKRNCINILSVDGSYTGTEYSDSAAIAGCYIDVYGNMYWYGDKHEKIKTPELIQTTINKINETRPDFVLLEGGGLQTIFTQWFNEKARQVWGSRYPFTLIEIDARKKKNKFDRLNSFIPVLNDNTTHIIKEHSKDIIETLSNCSKEKLKRIKNSTKSKSLGLDMLDAMEQLHTHYITVGKENLRKRGAEPEQRQKIDTSYR